MNYINTRKNNRLYLSIIILCVIYFISWPLYKYITDPDGASYAAIADHYASGNFKEAINGLWSPLHSWLVIPLIKSGVNTIIAFKLTNLIFGILFLISIHLYLTKSSIEIPIQKWILFSTVIILSYYIWYELAADLLFSLLIFNYLKIALSHDFKVNRKKNIIAGILGGTAYLSKAIGLPFFIIHYTAIHFFQNRSFKNKIYLWGIMFCIMIAAPWIYTLYHKYEHLMISAHLRLTLNPESTSTEEFFPPPNPLSFFVWEDPWAMHNKFSFPADSLSGLIAYLRELLFNFQGYLNVLFRISFLAPAICFLSIYFLFIKRTEKTYFTFITLFVLAGLYIPFHLEERFLWPISFVMMIAGVYYLKKLMNFQDLKKHQTLLIWSIYFGSFITEPINQLKDISCQNKDLYEIAALMKKHNINGSFTSNKKYVECGIVAYISKTKYYTPRHHNYEINKLISSARNYGIKYLLLFARNNQEKKYLKAILPQNMKNSAIILSDKILAVNLQPD
jgi:hypothetical protein